VPPGAAKLTLLHNSLLVPEKYDRDIRHYEFKWLGWVSWGVDLEASEANGETVQHQVFLSKP